MMCRFFSGQLQNHQLLKKYDSYIRFDDDSFFIDPIIHHDDFLKQLHQNDYVFRSVFREGQSQQTLFEFTKQFCKDNGGFDIPNNIPGIIQNGQYTGLSPYNNFHYCKLSLWQHPMIKLYVDTIDKLNGCLINNWMDANIHAMIIFILMPLISKKCSAITNFGYRHNRHFSVIGSLSVEYREKEEFFPKA